MSTPAQLAAQANRNTIFVEDGEILSVATFPGDQFVMRIRAAKCAAAAKPGSFVHVTCDVAKPMRRPLSIMRAQDDWIEILYKIVGEGLRLLSQAKPGDKLSLLGPIGQAFKLTKQRRKPLLIGGGVGIPPMVFLADALRADNHWQPLAILGSEIPFPFELIKSTIDTAWADDSIKSSMPLLESWGIPARLATLSGFDGCFDGYVTGLAEQWLQSLSTAELAEVEIFSCGPTPMLKAVADLANKYDVPCQVSLEEFMACAVGGCAGCTVEVSTPDGPAMKRVCVDGPVFNANEVVWQ